MRHGSKYWGLLLKMVCKQLSGEYWILVVWTFHFIPISTCFLITKNGLRCFVFLKFVQGASPPNPSPEAPPLDSVGAAPQTPAVARTKSYICGFASLAARAPLKQKSWLRPWEGGGGSGWNCYHAVIRTKISSTVRGLIKNIMQNSRSFDKTLFFILDDSPTF